MRCVVIAIVCAFWRCFSLCIVCVTLAFARFCFALAFCMFASLFVVCLFCVVINLLMAFIIYFYGKYQKTIGRKCVSTMVVCVVVVIRLLFAFLRLHRGFIEHNQFLGCFSGFCVTVLRIGWCGSAWFLFGFCIVGVNSLFIVVWCSVFLKVVVKLGSLW